MNGLGVVAEALNRGEIARAQVATLLLKLPDPGRVDAATSAGLRKLAVLLESGWIAKDWDPSKHPRVGAPPNPGWFASTDGGAADALKPSRPAGIEVAEIKPTANPAVAGNAPSIIVPAGGEEEERFPWEEPADEGGTYFNPVTGQTTTIQPGSGIVLREPWIRLEDLPTQTYLRAPATETWVDPDSLDQHYIDHADEFGAASPEAYAEQANEFYEEAQQRGYKVKVDADGTVRIYDPKTNTFGSYTTDGKTITFFKPDNPSYFDRQPGVLKKRDENGTTQSPAIRGKAMRVDAKFICPVCGCGELKKPPRSETTGGSYEICPCCGFEFGYHDEDQGISDGEWRRRWVAKGMPWSARTRRPPPGWDPVAQLRRLTSAISGGGGPASTGGG